MIVISHRGYWIDPEEMNTGTAFRRSFDLGFGTETDIRDCLGTLVVSHDPPKGKEMNFETFLSILANRDLPLALNIKSAGLAVQLKELMDSHKLSSWFVFDMAVPDLIEFHKYGIPFFTRLSEYEKEPILYEASVGIWLDAFHEIWFDADLIERFLADKKKVCVVSSELHGRDPAELWKMLHRPELIGRTGMMICTDIPEQAMDFFGEKQ